MERQRAAMNREHILSVLYDIGLVIGGEVSIKPLLTKTLQRLLYHTSFPTGLVFLDVPPGDGDTVVATPAVAIGDFGFSALVGQALSLPAPLLRGGPEVCEAPELLAALPGATRHYNVFLRLPIDHCGVLLMLAPRQPSTQLPLTEIFRPVMANLAKAILLCRHNDAYTAGLVAERDLAQQSLAESEVRFRSITTVAQDAIVMIDRDGRIAYWNPAAEHIFGYRADEVMGRDAHALMTPERYRAAFKAGFEHFLVDGTGPVVGKTVEVEGLRKDGSEFPIELSISALQLQGHWNAVGLMRDITDRRAAELALHRANRALKTLSGCNGILVRALDETRLLHDICGLIVEAGGYRGACVGYADTGSGLRQVARAGMAHADTEAFERTRADNCGVADSALRALHSGQPQLAQGADGSGPDGGIAASIALPLRDNGAAFGVLNVYAEVRDAFSTEEIALLTELADDLAFGIVTLRTRAERESLEAARRAGNDRLKRALLGTIQALAMTVEKRDPYTAGHQQKVARLAVAIATELGWPPDQIEGVRLGGMLHDIGKIYVPSEILSRPGKLSELEFGLIRSHPEVGYEILQGVELPWPVAEIILQHHERLDGKGYPHGLTGDRIIPEARLLAIADVVEAMASHRPYRAALGVDSALEEIVRCRGSQFDADMVDGCVRVFRERGFRFE
ncbi:PAS domain S-box protein [Parasulfuritortus cantonensis]|uniref:PAS domain S-box protein n=1 Tax=Parasulfuritortus cantonensis TaxID=2528202 RepID=A0A4R1B729_9PROT|nr:HD domain-containing phosphohydrolase [Parasulfuritortus cantonensis]TCJ12228.1 PAS domain S-box protein [Parasulfuritortus cantonensis]